MEEWKDVEGYEQIYQVSNTGKVKSLDRYVKREGTSDLFIKGRILKEGSNGKYKTVNLCKDNITQNKYIHRLVAKAFVENPNNKKQVNHIDENILNNNSNNLEWVTSKENMNHSKFKIYDSLPKGENSFFAKLDNINVLTIYTFKQESYNNKFFSVLYNVHPSVISNVRRGKKWKHLTQCKPLNNPLTSSTERTTK